MTSKPHPPGPRGRRGRHGPRGPRRPGGPGGRRGRNQTRIRTEDGWAVTARVARFVEPAVLLLLRDTASYGYDLTDELEDILGERVDHGNLYRMLRSFEEDGLVTSEWRDDLPGRSKRTYRLTSDGLAVLDQWAEALAELQGNIDDFLARHHGDGDQNSDNNKNNNEPKEETE